MSRIQVITLIISVLFLVLISRLVIKGRLREEYSIMWLIFAFILVVFSFWESGLRQLSTLFGVEVPSNLVFTISIFITLVYLLHLSVVSSKLHKQNKLMAQEIALLKVEMNELKETANHNQPTLTTNPK